MRIVSLLLHCSRWLWASLGLAAVLLTACGPQGSLAATASVTTELPLATPTQAATTTPTADATQPAPTAAATPTDLLPVATSRGNELEATDPETVKLASGGLQLVEFFAFW